jgi:hypothetical protein
MRLAIVCCAAALAACYDPEVECRLAPCAPIVGETPLPAIVDASIGMTPDAKSCAPGCVGTCDDGVCVIECIGSEACEEEVVCPLSGPCRVTCSGRKACNEGVRCGLGRCTVTCSGDEACHKRVRCETSCACDVTCGPDACKDDAWCPRPWCAAGDGCTSVPDSCNAC